MAQAVRLARGQAPIGQELPCATLVVANGEIVGVSRDPERGIRGALADAGELARGAVVYTTTLSGDGLEETRAAASAGVKRIAVGMAPPELGVAAIQRWESGDLAVSFDVNLDHVWDVASPALICRGRRRPLVVAKLATSLDGRIATAAGESQWITGPDARAAGHRLRRDAGAIVVGTRTVIADDPRLTARLDDDLEAPSPRRVVISTRPELPAGAALRNTSAAPTCVYHAVIDSESAGSLHADGVETRHVPGSGGRVDARAVLDDLFDRGVAYVLLEGGAGLHWTFFSAGLVDRTVHFLAPVVLGGEEAPGAVGGVGFVRIGDAPRGIRTRTRTVGSDLEVVTDFARELLPVPVGGRSIAG